MKENLRSPRPYNQIKDSLALREIDGALKKRPGYFREIYMEFAQIIGPLTVRERWDLLGDYGLETQRLSVKLEGAADDIAALALNSFSLFGYPANVLILQLVDDLGTLPDEVKPRLDQLLEQKK